MLIPLSSVQFTANLLIEGQTMNKIVDPSVKDKTVELTAIDVGVVLKLKSSHLVPWSMIQRATAAAGFEFSPGAWATNQALNVKPSFTEQAVEAMPGPVMPMSTIEAPRLGKKRR